MYLAGRLHHVVQACSRGNSLWRLKIDQANDVVVAKLPPGGPTAAKKWKISVARQIGMGEYIGQNISSVSGSGRPVSIGLGCQI